MLRSLKELFYYILASQDGEIGRCKDFLFDDRFWTIRYMVADTGKWLPGRKVLVSPISLGEPDWGSRLFPVRLTKKQVEDAPGLDQDAPVSRQYEIAWTQFYGWPYYWEGPYAWGSVPHPDMIYDGRLPEEQAEKVHSKDDNLRSADEVTGYHIRATDGEVGHVEDFIVDDATWTIRFLVVDTRNWLPGKKVLIKPSWVDSVNWVARKVKIDLPRETIKNSPEYDPSMPVNREYEERLYDFYGRAKN
jgi:hypothetical protein